MYKITNFKIVSESEFLEAISPVGSPLVCAFPGVGKSTLLDSWKESRNQPWGKVIDFDFGNVRSVFEDEHGIKFSSFGKTTQSLLQQLYISAAEVLSHPKAVSGYNQNSIKPNMILCNIPDSRFEAMIIPHVACSHTYTMNVKKRDPKNSFASAYEKNFENWVLGWFESSMQEKAQHQVLYILTNGLYLTDIYNGEAKFAEFFIENEELKFSKKVRLAVRHNEVRKAWSYVEPILNYLNPNK